MSLSRKSAAQLALYLAVSHPGIFDAFVRSLPGAREALKGFGAFGDDGSDDVSADDVSADEAGDDSTDVSLDDSGLTSDDENAAQDLRLLNIDGGDTYSTPVAGSAADLASQGMSAFGQPVMGSFADPNEIAVAGDIQSTQNAITDELGVSLTAPASIDDITPVVQGISSAHTVASIGAPALSAATSALASSNGLNALSNIATAYLNNQAALGQQQTALQLEANNVTAQMQLAALEHPTTPMRYISGPDGQEVAVMSNGATGAPLIGANGQYVTAAQGTGILSALTSAGSIMPLVVIGGIGLLLMLLLDHHGGGSPPPAPERRRPRFMELE